jgi:hypothetical protein
MRIVDLTLKIDNTLGKFSTKIKPHQTHNTILSFYHKNLSLQMVIVKKEFIDANILYGRTENLCE